MINKPQDVVLLGSTATQNPFNEKGLLKQGPNELGKQGCLPRRQVWVLFTKAGCGRANRGELGWCVVEPHKDTVLSPHPRVPGAPAPGLGCISGWQGEGTSLTRG